MASKKTPAAKKLANTNKQSAKTVVVKAAATKAATRTVPAATGTAAAVKPVAASPAAVSPTAKAAPIDPKVAAALTGSPDAVCANLAALRTALAGEKAREGAAERKKMAKDLEALEAGYRELHE